MTANKGASPMDVFDYVNIVLLCSFTLLILTMIMWGVMSYGAQDDVRLVHAKYAADVRKILDEKHQETLQAFAEHALSTLREQSLLPKTDYFGVSAQVLTLHFSGLPDAYTASVTFDKSEVPWVVRWRERNTISKTRRLADERIELGFAALKTVLGESYPEYRALSAESFLCNDSAFFGNDIAYCGVRLYLVQK